MAASSGPLSAKDLAASCATEHAGTLSVTGSVLLVDGGLFVKLQ